MENEILIALLTKLVDERIALIPEISAHRGPRGFPGQPGQPGKDFVFEEHEDQIKSWAREFAIKFEDYTSDQIENLRGPKGKDGRPGKDFIFEDYENQIRSWAKEFALKFQDLSAEQVESLRGPKGRDGKDGTDGIGFIWEEHGDRIRGIIRSTVEGISDELKLKFSDLSADDIDRIRGPRGRDGRDGRDFIFDEHREFFNSLKLKFTDLTEEEKNSLKLHFAELTEEEKSSLKLRFKDLTDEDLSLIRGARGPRGQKGIPGRQGETGLPGMRGLRGLPGVRGIAGLTGPAGNDGRDGNDGQDAPYIVDINIEQRDDEIVFVFLFSDGQRIETDKVKLPPSEVVQVSGGISRMGRANMNYEVRVDEVDWETTYIGHAQPGSANEDAVWRIQKVLTVGNETSFEYADGDSHFDNVWDDRASLTYE